jgi:hypothetical protein
MSVCRGSVGALEPSIPKEFEELMLVSDVWCSIQYFWFREDKVSESVDRGRHFSAEIIKATGMKVFLAFSLTWLGCK